MNLDAAEVLLARDEQGRAVPGAYRIGRLVVKLTKTMVNAPGTKVQRRYDARPKCGRALGQVHANLLETTQQVFCPRPTDVLQPGAKTYVTFVAVVSTRAVRPTESPGCNQTAFRVWRLSALISVRKFRHRVEFGCLQLETRRRYTNLALERG